MNSIKTTIVLAVLLGAGYWVYTRVNTTGPSAPPPAAADMWSSPPDVQMPSMPGGAPQYGAADGLAAPPWDGASAAAQASPGTAGGPMAPPFQSGGSYDTSAAPSPAELGGAGSNAPPLAPTPVPGEDDALPPPFPPQGYPIAPDPTQPQPPRLDNMAVASEDAALAGGSVASAAGGAAGGAGQFDRLMELVRPQLESGSLAEALETLSRSYGDPRLSADESRQLTGLLDQIAGTVIYSRQHLLEPPRVVKAGETLDQIAAEYHVPAGILAKINGIRDPQNLEPGSQLKVVRGPFTAVVNIEKRELTLMLQGRYAGRFRIGVGRDCPDIEGTYEVKDKTVNPTYYGRDQVVDAEDPANPWGERWIGLGNPAGDAAQITPIGIHGTDNPLNIGATADRGIICLGERDVEDVYDILSIGSRVVIRR